VTNAATTMVSLWTVVENLSTVSLRPLELVCVQISKLANYTHRQTVMLKFYLNSSECFDFSVCIFFLFPGPGPPTNLEISNITATSMKVKWEPPQADNGNLVSYSISASPTFTYAKYSETSHQWSFPNNTKHYELLDLHPGTTYNISIQSVGTSQQGYSVSKVVSTKIGGKTLIKCICCKPSIRILHNWYLFQILKRLIHRL